VSLLVASSGAAASSLPSGEVLVGKTVIEPAYDDTTGSLTYLSTPLGTNGHANLSVVHNVAPIYLPMYPVDGYQGVLNCQDTTAATTENCPDHGPLVAGATMGISLQGGFGSVYASGMRGHDHLVGIAATGGDFNILWEPVLVIFTNAQAASQHVTTLSQINTLISHRDAIEVPIAAATFHCAAVSAAVYNNGTPFTGKIRDGHSVAPHVTSFGAAGR
jgi:hypothetical protein